MSVKQVNARYKMNETVTVITFLLGRDKFIPEMNLIQIGFKHSACGTFKKNKERIEKIKETGDSQYIY